jgi:hypothetical protein
MWIPKRPTFRFLFKIPKIRRMFTIQLINPKHLLRPRKSISLIEILKLTETIEKYSTMIWRLFLCFRLLSEKLLIWPGMNWCMKLFSFSLS